MKKYLRKIASTSLFSLILLSSSQAFAVNHPYDFHADARMVHPNLGPVNNAYGYMNVITDSTGRGMINVMFSNGSPLTRARFNARVKFLDAKGIIIREELFDHRIGAATDGEAIERKVSKPLAVSNFESIEVDFYLTD